MNLVVSNNKVYDVLKFVAQIFLPALGALYFGLSEIWGFPNGAEIVGTITVIDVFLGALLGLSANSYYAQEKHFQGSLDVYETEDTKKFVVNLDDDPYDLDEREELRLKVNRV